MITRSYKFGQYGHERKDSPQGADMRGMEGKKRKKTTVSIYWHDMQKKSIVIVK